MSDIKELFSTELIDFNISVENENELFKEVSDKLLELGYVNNGYLNGIINREAQFPTGLITQHLNIALPHSDCEFIEKPFVNIVRLKEPILVKQMGDSREMFVSDLLFLGIKDPNGQVGLLSKLMELFMSEEFVNGFIKTETPQEMYEIIIKNI